MARDFLKQYVATPPNISVNIPLIIPAITMPTCPSDPVPSGGYAPSLIRIKLKLINSIDKPPHTMPIPKNNFDFVV